MKHELIEFMRAIEKALIKFANQKKGKSTNEYSAFNINEILGDKKIALNVRIMISEFYSLVRAASDTLPSSIIEKIIIAFVDDRQRIINQIRRAELKNSLSCLQKNCCSALSESDRAQDTLEMFIECLLSELQSYTGVIKAGQLLLEKTQERIRQISIDGSKEGQSQTSTSEANFDKVVAQYPLLADDIQAIESSTLIATHRLSHIIISNFQLQNNKFQKQFQDNEIKLTKLTKELDRYKDKIRRLCTRPKLSNASTESTPLISHRSSVSDSNAKTGKGNMRGVSMHAIFTKKTRARYDSASHSGISSNTFGNE